MKKFEIEANGRKFEVEAADFESAMRAAQEYAKPQGMPGNTGFPGMAPLAIPTPPESTPFDPVLPRVTPPMPAAPVSPGPVSPSIVQALSMRSPSLIDEQLLNLMTPSERPLPGVPAMVPNRTGVDPRPAVVMSPEQAIPNGPLPLMTPRTTDGFVPDVPFDPRALPQPTPMPDLVQEITQLMAPPVYPQAADVNPAGTLIGREIRRGVLSTRASLPTARATAAASLLGDYGRPFEDILAEEMAALPPGAPPQMEQTAYLVAQTRFDRAANVKEEDLAGILEQGVKDTLKADELMDRAEEIPRNPRSQQAIEILAQTPDEVGATLTAIKDNPLAFATFLAEVGVQSSPQIIASLVTGAVTRSPAASTGVMGAGAFAQEYGASAREFLREEGIEINTPEDAVALLNDPEMMRKASQRGATRGLVIAAMEAIGQKVAGARLGRTEVGNQVAQTGVQMATGGGGEALASLASGQDLSAQEIILEAMAEGLTAPAEIGVAAVSSRTPRDQQAPAAPVAPGQDAPPNVSRETPAAPAKPANPYAKTFDMPAEASDEAVSVTLSAEGPWDFNDTWPAPDPDLVRGADQEGRLEFDPEDGEQVVSVLDEAMSELTEYTAIANGARAEIEHLRAGGKLRIPQKELGLRQGETPQQALERIAATADRDIEDLAASYADRFGPNAADAMKAEAQKRVGGERRAPDAPPTQIPPASPAPAGTSPGASPVPPPVPSQADGSASGGGRWEEMDETETVNGQSVPTGRRVRVNLDTGQVQVVSDGSGDAEVLPRAADEPRGRGDGGAGPAARAEDGLVYEDLTSEDVAEIGFDAKAFQYKEGGNEQGVTERLQGIGQWDRRAAGTALVYEYEDGRRVIADGHQRLGLAQRLQAQGVDTPWRAEVLREADGYTPADARRIAAMVNIKNDSGTALDAAKVLRDGNEDPAELGLPVRSQMVQDAIGLSRLSDQAFGMVVNERATQSHGGIVGRVVEDPRLHADILALLGRLKPENKFQAEAIARQAASETRTETQTSLFGDEEVARNLYLERAKVLDGAVKRLKQDERTFQTLVDRADAISAEGNRLDANRNQQRLASDARLREYLDRQANTKGPISDALSSAARRFADGDRASQAIDEFIKAVRQELEGVQPDRGRDNPPRRKPDAPAGRPDQGDQPQEVARAVVDGYDYSPDAVRPLLEASDYWQPKGAAYTYRLKKVVDDNIAAGPGTRATFQLFTVYDGGMRWMGPSHDKYISLAAKDGKLWQGSRSGDNWTWKEFRPVDEPTSTAEQQSDEPETDPDDPQADLLEAMGAPAKKPTRKPQAKPTEGRFGPILSGYGGDWKGASLALEARQSGEAPGALSHPDIGPVALVWGQAGTSRSDGYGLAKIIAWHPEVLDDLQGRFARMTVTSRTDNRIQLESEADRAGVRLDWDGKAGLWLIGAYSKEAPRRTEKFTGTLDELWAGMSPQPRRGNREDSAPGASRQPTTRDLFDQGENSQPGERQTDLEDLIAEKAEREPKDDLLEAMGAPKPQKPKKPAAPAKPPTETVTPDEDTLVGRNLNGDFVYQRADGFRYTRRAGPDGQPTGRVETGKITQTVEEEEADGPLIEAVDILNEVLTAENNDGAGNFMSDT